MFCSDWRSPRRRWPRWLHCRRQPSLDPRTEREPWTTSSRSPQPSLTSSAGWYWSSAWDFPARGILSRHQPQLGYRVVETSRLLPNLHQTNNTIQNPGRHGYRVNYMFDDFSVFNIYNFMLALKTGLRFSCHNSVQIRCRWSPSKRDI